MNIELSTLEERAEAEEHLAEALRILNVAIRRVHKSGLFVQAEILKMHTPEYEARFSIEGEVRISIKAASLEDAKEQARKMLDEEGFGRELDDVLHVKVDRVMKSPTMFLVTREGRPMQVSHLEDDDQPRQLTIHLF